MKPPIEPPPGGTSNSHTREELRKLGGAAFSIGLAALISIEVAVAQGLQILFLRVVWIVLLAFGLLVWIGSYLRPIGKSVESRALDAANRVRETDTKSHRHPPFTFPSAYGLRATVARALANWNKGYRRFHIRRPYTRRLHKRVVETIEELGRAGYRDPHLKRFLSQEPEKHELEDLALKISWLAQKKYADHHGIDVGLGS